MSLQAVRDRLRQRSQRGVGATAGPAPLPVACGAVGAVDQARVQAIAAALDPSVKEVHASSRAILMLDREPLRWQGDTLAGFAWTERPYVPSGRVTNPRQAAVELAACGIAVGGERALVHASAHGLLPLYTLSAGDATYFATSLAALAQGAGRTLTVDWEAWASIFELGVPLGRGTGFREIARLEPAAVVEHGRGGSPTVETAPWQWAGYEVGSSRDPKDEILAALTTELRRVAAPSQPVSCPLSGGWDSRLAAFLLREHGADVRTWTVSSDAGHTGEETIAAQVAAELGLSNRIVPSKPADYWRDWLSACTLQEHQSPTHLPMEALGRRLAREPGPIVDGLAGDVLIKNWWVSRAMLDAESWPATVRLLWRRFRFSLEGTPLLRRRVALAVASSARAQFRQEAERFDGHPAGASLFILWARTRRSTGPSPMALFGSRRAVSVPFVNDDLARAALSVPPHQKLQGAFYRQVLERADPRLSALPSTNDKGYDAGPRDLPRRSASAQAHAGYVERMRSHPLRDAFSTRFARAVDEGRLEPYLAVRQRLLALDALCRFGDWHGRYAGVLAPLDAADLQQL